MRMKNFVFVAVNIVYFIDSVDSDANEKFTNETKLNRYDNFTLPLEENYFDKLFGEFNETLDNTTSYSQMEQRIITTRMQLAEMTNKFREEIKSMQYQWQNCNRSIDSFTNEMSTIRHQVESLIRICKESTVAMETLTDFQEQVPNIIVDFLRRVKEAMVAPPPYEVKVIDDFVRKTEDSLVSLSSFVYQYICEPNIPNVKSPIPVMMKIGETMSTFLCDTETDGGGWIIFQRRIDGNLQFNRTWNDFKQGFGFIDTDYWLGNDNLYQLTSKNTYTLRIDMIANGTKVHVNYNTFLVASEEQNYRLTIHGHQGPIADRMINHNGQSFSTWDRDNDNQTMLHCAELHNSGWWFSDCFLANLNGVYRTNGLYWSLREISITLVEMKIKERKKKV